MRQTNSMNNETSIMSDENILIVKARFKSAGMNLYGQVLVIFNNQKLFESYNAVVSTYSDAYDLELHTSWDRYEEFIADLKWKGHFNTSMTSSLMNQFKELSSDNGAMTRFFNSVNNYDYDNLDILLYDLINRIFHEKNLTLESVIQEITPAEFFEVKERRSKPLDKSAGGKGLSDKLGLGKDAVILTVKPLLAPVKGTPIYALKIGDIIMSKVLPNSEKQNHYIDILGLREENQIRPVPAEVIDIKAGSGKNEPIEILTKLGDEIYGKIIEDEKQVKLRIYNPAVDGYIAGGTPFQKANRTTRAKTLFDDGAIPFGLSRGTITILLLFMAIMIMFTVLIFLSW